MISNFETMLKEAIRIGVAGNREFDALEHPGMIGDMYEGLTREILQSAVLDGMNVRVTKGKIKATDGTYSGQVDCMVVIGDGQRVPHTDHYVYDIDDVIAVIEVKKTLTMERLRDAVASLKQVASMRWRSAFSDATATAATRTERDAVRAVLKRPYPRNDSVVTPYASEVDNVMYATIRITAPMPLRVVWGYDGHRSESGFRDALVGVLGNNGIEDIAAWPDCVFSGSFQFVKSNGMPFAYDAPQLGGASTHIRKADCR